MATEADKPRAPLRHILALIRILRTSHRPSIQLYIVSHRI